MFDREDDIVERVIRQLRRPVSINPGVDARVMREIANDIRPQPRVRRSPLRSWPWLAAAAVLGGVVIARPWAGGGSALDPFQFVLVAPQAASVSLVGDFNDWDPARFGAWLYGILVNRCRTTGARAARRRRMFVHDVGALNGAAHPDQADRLEWSDAVSRALAQLAPEYREAFLLKHVEDLEYEEMAAMTGAGVSALKMRVKRAREQLQRFLKEAEHV